jgi:hypothetical protein
VRVQAVVSSLRMPGRGCVDPLLDVHALMNIVCNVCLCVCLWFLQSAMWPTLGGGLATPRITDVLVEEEHENDSDDTGSVDGGRSVASDGSARSLTLTLDGFHAAVGDTRPGGVVAGHAKADDNGAFLGVLLNLGPCCRTVHDHVVVQPHNACVLAVTTPRRWQLRPGMVDGGRDNLSRKRLSCLAVVGRGVVRGVCGAVAGCGAVPGCVPGAVWPEARRTPSVRSIRFGACGMTRCYLLLSVNGFVSFVTTAPQQNCPHFASLFCYHVPTLM